MLKQSHYISVDQQKSYINVYPYSLSEIISKYLKVSYDSISEKHSILCDAFESLIKFNSIVAIRCLLTQPASFNAVFAGGIDFLKHPSLGHWTSILRAISKNSKGCDLPDLVHSINDWYNSGEKNQAIQECYQDLPEIKFQKGCALNEGIINSLVTYRNKVWKGHGAVLVDPVDLYKRVRALEYLVFQLFDSIEFYKDMDVVYVNEVKMPSVGIYEANSTSLMGPSNESIKYRSSEPITQGDIYLLQKKDTDEMIEIALSPFVEWQKNPEGKYNFYFFNDAQRSKLEFLSYVDGSFYYHKELKRDFDNILNIHLQDAGENFEFIHYNFSQEERKQKSNELYVRGQQLAHDEKWEEALIVFENALEWYKDANIMLARCKMLIALDESEEYISTLLESVLEIETDNKEVMRLKESLKNDGGSKKEKIENTDVGYDSYENYKNHIYTIFDLVMPKKLIGKGPSVILGIILLFNIVSSLMMFLYDPEYFIQYIPAVLAVSIAESLILIVFPMLRSYYSSIYYQLYSQVNNMKNERYNKWFKESIFSMFGYIYYTENEKLRLDKEKEKFYFIITTSFVVVWSVAVIILQALYLKPLYLAVLQQLQATVFWTVVGFILRPLVMSSHVIATFSKLSLNPAISESNNQGYKALIGGFMRVLGLFVIFWFFFWVYLAVVCVDPYYTDLFGVLLAWIIICGWTIFTPLNIKMASKRAQNNCLLKYQNHTIDSFNAFIKDPNDTRKERLNWLLKSEKELRTMISKTMNLGQVMIIVLANIWVLLCGVVYSLYRLGMLDKVMDKLF